MYKYLYGPVKSWRFGNSLGVDPIYHASVCSFNCLYCQLGYIQKIQIKREEFISTTDFQSEINKSDFENLNVITFSGNGEPTLASNLRELFLIVKKRYANIPIHLLTNATLLTNNKVLEDIIDFDEICCKLDAIDKKSLDTINRATNNITIKKIIDGIVKLRHQYKKKLTIQVMVLKNSKIDPQSWIPILKEINPDKIYLNLPKRPYPKKWDRKYRGDHIHSSHQSESSDGQSHSLPLIPEEQQRLMAEKFQEALADKIVLV